VAGLYIDTSALARVMLGEPDTPAITAVLASFEQHFSSRLLAIELRRVALREAMPAVADALLGSVALVPLDEAILVHAETVMPATVATLDALHLATAIHLTNAGLVTTLLTYDERLAAGARAHGVPSLAPTAQP
jgi:predicted nucleic acid-binding protein